MLAMLAMASHFWCGPNRPLSVYFFQQWIQWKWTLKKSNLNVLWHLIVKLKIAYKVGHFARVEHFNFWFIQRTSFGHFFNETFTITYRELSYQVQTLRSGIGGGPSSGEVDTKTTLILGFWGVIANTNTGARIPSTCKLTHGSIIAVPGIL